MYKTIILIVKANQKQEEEDACDRIKSFVDDQSLYWNYSFILIRVEELFAVLLIITGSIVFKNFNTNPQITLSNLNLK